MHRIPQRDPNEPWETSDTGREGWPSISPRGAAPVSPTFAPVFTDTGRQWARDDSGRAALPTQGTAAGMVPPTAASSLPHASPHRQQEIRASQTCPPGGRPHRAGSLHPQAVPVHLPHCPEQSLSRQVRLLIILPSYLTAHGDHTVVK